MRWHRAVCRGVSAAMGGDQAPDGLNWADWGSSGEFFRHQMECILQSSAVPHPGT